MRDRLTQRHALRDTEQERRERKRGECRTQRGRGRSAETEKSQVACFLLYRPDRGRLILRPPSLIFDPRGFYNGMRLAGPSLAASLSPSTDCSCLIRAPLSIDPDPRDYTDDVSGARCRLRLNCEFETSVLIRYKHFFSAFSVLQQKVLTSDRSSVRSNALALYELLLFAIAILQIIFLQRLLWKIVGLLTNPDFAAHQANYTLNYKRRCQVSPSICHCVK